MGFVTVTAFKGGWKYECVMGHRLWFAFTLETKASSDYILRPREAYDTICLSYFGSLCSCYFFPWNLP